MLHGIKKVVRMDFQVTNKLAPFVSIITILIENKVFQ